MVKLILKVLAAMIAGFFMGIILGSLIGAATGVIVSLFFLEIIQAHLTTLVSILIAIVTGGILGLVIIFSINKLFETETRLILGVIVGALAGFVATILYGVIAPIYPMMFENMYVIPIRYGSSIGGQTGSIMYPVIAAAAFIRDTMRTNAEWKKNREIEFERRNELSFYKSKMDIDE